MSTIFVRREDADVAERSWFGCCDIIHQQGSRRWRQGRKTVFLARKFLRPQHTPARRKKESIGGTNSTQLIREHPPFINARFL